MPLPQSEFVGDIRTESLDCHYRYRPPVSFRKRENQVDYSSRYLAPGCYFFLGPLRFFPSSNPRFHLAVPSDSFLYLAFHALNIPLFKADVNRKT
jgi:hypothetical protein